MSKKPVTLTDYLLKEEMKYPNATGHFTLLITYIQEVGKIISKHIRGTTLTELLARTGDINKSGDETIKIDKLANNLLRDTLLESSLVYAIGSEEEEEIRFAKKKGEYIVYFDPIDGSSNVGINIPTGTIFSIYRGREVLQKGENQVAAGYILYGSSTTFVYTAGSSVAEFILDPSAGIFLLSKKEIKMPETGKIYSINEGYLPLFDKKLQHYLKGIKEEGYKLRYVGSMVVDIHRTLLKGGIFIYPADKKHPNGKLRLMYEVNPLSFIIKQAGGKAITLDTSPLEIMPEDIHQRVPIAIGSKGEIDKLLSFYNSR